jgi:hypothetical protein
MQRLYTLGTNGDQHPGATGFFSCPPQPKDHVYKEVYTGGGDNYNGNSAICAAAAYAGKISADKGGTFVVVYKGMLPRATVPAAAPKGGFTMKDYTGGDTFGFEPPAPIAPTLTHRGTSAMRLNWFKALFLEYGSEGETKTATCSPLAAEDAKVPDDDLYVGITENGQYTAGSSVCLAAAHAGKIALAKGGSVTVVRHPNSTSARPLTGEAKNGVKSKKSTDGGRFFYTFQ